MKNLEISLGNISVEASDSDETLMQKARQHLPVALRKVGERMGEETWTTMEKSFRNSIIKLKSADKGPHVRDSGEQYARNADAATRKQLVQTIFEQLQTQRAAKQ